MNHPQTRSERRSVRELCIKRRKEKLLLNQWISKNDIPHMGEGYRYDQYINYLNFLNLTEDEVKILEVEAALDGVDFEPPTWTTTVWGRYAKLHSLCSCRGCRNKKEHIRGYKRQRRRQLDKLLQEGLQDYVPI